MLPSRPDHVSRMLAERMLITRIITALGLALLLVLGAWSGSHADGDGGTHIVTASASDGIDAAPLAHTETTAEASIDAGSLLQALTTCLLGIFCAILLFALVRQFQLRHAPPLRSSREPVVLALVAPPARILTPSTLIELSISRT